jgi:hypothetical protein
MAASAEMVRHAIVDLRDQLGDGRVEFPERKELLVASFGTINRIATCTATSTLAFVPRPMRPLADAARGALSPTRAVADVPCWGLLARDKADPPWAQDVDFPK